MKTISKYNKQFDEVHTHVLSRLLHLGLSSRGATGFVRSSKQLLKLSLFVLLTILIAGCTTTGSHVIFEDTKIYGLDDPESPTVRISTSTGKSDRRYLIADIDKDNRRVSRFFVKVNTNPSKVLHTFKISFFDKSGRKVTMSRASHSSKIVRSRFRVVNYISLPERSYRSLFSGHGEFVKFSAYEGIRYLDNRRVWQQQTSEFYEVKFKTKDSRDLDRAISRVMAEL